MSASKIFNVLGFSVILGFSSGAYANPQGGEVVGGSATITQTPGEVRIDQSTDKAIINWNKFNIDAGETTRFVQPSSSSTALNRVFDTQQSVIAGNLIANGNVILINPNGILITKTGNVNTHSFIATIRDISNSAFMNSTGKYDFNIKGNDDAVLENDGTITVAEEGMAKFVGPNVHNNGTINGKVSKVKLDDSELIAVDFYGDGLLSVAFAENKNIFQNKNDVIIENEGEIRITVGAASEALKSVVNTGGMVPGNEIQVIGTQVSIVPTVEIAGAAMEINTKPDNAKNTNRTNIVNEISGYGKVPAPIKLGPDILGREAPKVFSGDVKYSLMHPSLTAKNN